MGRLFNIFACAFSATSGLLFGYDSGIITTTIAQQAFNVYFNKPDSSMTGAIVSVFAGGCFFGAAAAGWLADKYSRKWSITIGCVWGLFGCSLQTGARNVTMLLMGRLFAGFAVGLLSMVAPLYQTEIADPRIRGFLVGLQQQGIGLGFVIANWVGYGTSFMTGDIQWRLGLGLQLVFFFTLGVGIIFLPYSPRWLLLKGRDDEAYQTVKRLHGNGTNQEWVDREYSEMKQQITYEREMAKPTLWDLVNTPAMLHRTLLAISIQVFTQMTGVNVINYYQTKLYTSLGIVGHKALLVTGIYGAVGPITNFFTITILLDRVGRTKPLIFGGLGMACCFAVEAAILHTYPAEVNNDAAHRAGVAMLFLFTILFSLSYGPISWVYMSELFNSRTRSLGVSVGVCGNWAANVLFSQTGPIGMDQSGWKFYIAFVCFNVFTSAMVFLFFPETKGHTLEQMEEVFGDATRPHDHGIVDSSSIKQKDGFEMKSP